LGCKIGCNFCKALYFNVCCGENGTGQKGIVRYQALTESKSSLCPLCPIC
jgi:hypothetical protein